MAAGNVIFIEGFDKYGPAGSGTAGGISATNFQALMVPEWTSVSASNGLFAIVAPLSNTGTALQLQLGSNTSSCTMRKALSSNYTRIVGGIRFRMDNMGDRAHAVLQFQDTSNNIQAQISFDNTNHIQLYGANATTLVATGSVVPATGTVHFLEWDITIGSAGAYTLYLDGVSIASGTGNFKSSTLASYSQFLMPPSQGTGAAAWQATFDDLYLCDDTGTPLLTNPAVETDFPSSDNTVAFTVQAAIAGFYNLTTTTTNAPGANELFLRRIQAPAGGCTLTSVSTLPAATSAAANFKAVVYADNAGTPNAQSLLGSASVSTTGCTAGTVLTSALSSGLALTGGSFYWIGFITDTSVALSLSDTLVTGVKAANTYTSGPPATCPTVTTGQSDWILWANLTGVNNNTYEVDLNPSIGVYGDLSYVQSSTVGAEDLYNFPSLAVTPSVIHSVAVKAFIRDSDSGARTVTMNMKSSGTDGTGSAAAATPSTTYGWMSSYFSTDPHTSTAWTASGLNAALVGYKIAS